MAQRLLQDVVSARAEAPPPVMGRVAWSRALRRALSAAAYVLPPLIALLVAGVVWEVWVRVDNTPAYIVPAPSKVFDRLFSDPGFFAHRAWITLAEALAGFGIGSGASILLAIAMAHSRLVERGLFPLAILVKVTPMIAVAPLFIIWFGFGPWPKVFVASLITFYPVLVNGIVGFRSVNPGALDFLRSVHASPLEVFWRLRMPSSLPYLFAGFRIAVPLAIIGAIAGEWWGASDGIGAVIKISHDNLDMATLFAAIVTLAVMGVGLTLITAAIEQRLVFWHESSLAR